MPSIVTYGFMGIDAKPNMLTIAPNLPKACPGMSISNLLYHNITMDINVTEKEITISLKDEPLKNLNVQFAKSYEGIELGKTATEFVISKAGVYRFKCN